MMRERMDGVPYAYEPDSPTQEQEKFVERMGEAFELLYPEGKTRRNFDSARITPRVAGQIYAMVNLTWRAKVEDSSSQPGVSAWETILGVVDAVLPNDSTDETKYARYVAAQMAIYHMQFQSVDMYSKSGVEGSIYPNNRLVHGITGLPIRQFSGLDRQPWNGLF